VVQSRSKDLPAKASSCAERALEDAASDEAPVDEADTAEAGTARSSTAGASAAVVDCRTNWLLKIGPELGPFMGPITIVTLVLGASAGPDVCPAAAAALK